MYSMFRRRTEGNIFREKSKKVKVNFTQDYPKKIFVNNREQ